MYDREDACIVWLSVSGLPYEGMKRLWDDFGDATGFYEQFVMDPAVALQYGPRTCMETLLERGSRRFLGEMLDRMARHEIRPMSREHPRYPRYLRKTDNPPLILFYQGDPNCLTARCSVTMAGARNASAHGLEVTRKTAADLAEKGVTIVSGLARGVDTAAHEGCLDAGGRTAAVLACGLDIEYPAGTMALRRRIVKHHGVILSEYPPGTPVRRWHFDGRNSIMAGMGCAALVPECREASGTMLTVHHARRHGRPVFVHPSPENAAAPRLLAEGAKPFHTAQDVFNGLHWHTEADGLVFPPTPEQLRLKEAQHSVLLALVDGPCTFSQLRYMTELAEPLLTEAVTTLLLDSLIYELTHGTYARR